MAESSDNSFVPHRYEPIRRLPYSAVEAAKSFDPSEIVKLVVYSPAIQLPPPYELLSNPTENEIHSAANIKRYYGEVSDIGLYFAAEAIVRGSGYALKDNHRLYGPDIIPAYVENAIESGTFEEINNGRERKVTHLERTAALICNEGYLIYGHWLVDLIPKAWMFFAHYGSLPEDVIYPFCDDTPDYGLKILSDLFGIPSSRFHIYNNRTDDLLVDRLVVPSLMHNSHIFHPRAALAVDFVREKVIGSKQASSKGNNIYVSRQKFRNKSISSKRFIDNEDELTSIAASYGYEVIYPEELSWAEQVKIFSEAKNIVGEAGSGLHNTIFSSKQSHVLTICDSQLQGTLAALLGQRLTLIGPKEAYWSGDTMHFKIDSDRFAQALARMA